MQRFGDDSLVQSYGCRALAALAIDHVAAGIAATTCGGIEAVVHAMRYVMSTTQASGAGRDASADSGSESESESDPAPDPAADSEARVHSDTAVNLLHHCCCLLWQLGLGTRALATATAVATAVATATTATGWLGCTSPSTAEAVARIVSAGGVAAIVTAMSRHPRVFRIQECGCGALRCVVAVDPSAKAIVAASGAVDVVVRTMRYFEGGSDADTTRRYQRAGVVRTASRLPVNACALLAALCVDETRVVLLRRADTATALKSFAARRQPASPIASIVADIVTMWTEAPRPKG
jgi:hypothetical protein